MINPSIPGWIDKFFLLEEKAGKIISLDEETFYDQTRATGFTFGHIVQFDSEIKLKPTDWLDEEVSKIGLLNTLFQLFRVTTQNSNSQEFLRLAVEYYDVATPKVFKPLNLVLANSSDSGKLEKIIHDRIQTNEDIFSKSFSHIIVNALLFLDVLGFQHYLRKGMLPEKYFSKMEELVISTISLSLQSKTGKSVHDTHLLKLFEASLRYSKNSGKEKMTLDTLKIDILENYLEKMYIIDLAGLSLWSDEKVENEERYFLFLLGEKIGIAEKDVLKSIDFINFFITTYRNEIPYFNYSNPVKHFYDNTTEFVSILITRNKNRLLKELSQSKELMQLIAKSTHKELDKEEKRKVKRQLLDICKTVPSLTIFLLPGGSLLLPIFIKFIPKLLPSAFNENESD